jgi:hypothetical protein
MHLLPMNRHFGRRVKSETHLVASDIDYRDDDVVVDDKALIAFAS